MRYRLAISPDAEQDIREVLDYLTYSIEGIGNPLIAKKIYRNLEETFSKVRMFPEGFSLCDDSDLKNLDIRKIKIAHYNYDIFYHIINDLIVVDMVCHNLRDYGKILRKRI